MTQTTQVMSISPASASADKRAEHEAAMAAKGEKVLLSIADLDADGTRTTTTLTPPETAPEPPEASQPKKAQKPEHVPDKFWNEEKGEVDFAGWAKSTRELEARFTRQQQQQKQQTPTDNDPASGNDTVDPFTSAAAEYERTGELSADARAALVKAGVPEHIIDVYLSGLKAQEQMMLSEAHAITGGEDNYNAMVQWARENLSEAEIDAFDAAISDPMQRKSAIEGLYARFQLHGNFEGTPVQGQAPRGVSGEMFRSRHEMQAAMSDPRYLKGDRAFHAEVQMKMANALAAGIDLFS